MKEQPEERPGTTACWWFRRAHVIALRERPEAEALAEMTGKLGFADAEARRLRAEAAGLHSQAEIQAFIGSPLGYLAEQWMPCREDGATRALRCEVGRVIDESGVTLDAVVFAGGRADAPKLVLSRPTGNGRQSGEGVPTSILVSAAGRFEELLLPNATRSNLSVLLDLEQRRALLGEPRVLRSTFTKLMFLDRSYSGLLEKFDDRVGFLGERVATWRIRWPEDAG